MKGRIRRPSPALIVSVVALVAALGGTAVGLPGSRNVDRNDLKRNTVGPNQLRANAVTNKHTALFKSSVLKKASAAASQAAAPAIVLLTRKSLQIYGKCFADGPDVNAEIYLRSTQAGAVLTSDGDDEEGDGTEPLDGYVNPGEDEEEHEIASATANGDADSDVEPYLAIRGSTAIDGQAGVFVKDGALPAGDGPYGAGDRCLFHAIYGGAG